MAEQSKTAGKKNTKPTIPQMPGVANIKPEPTQAQEAKADEEAKVKLELELREKIEAETEAKYLAKYQKEEEARKAKETEEVSEGPNRDALEKALKKQDEELKNSAYVGDVIVKIRASNPAAREGTTVVGQLLPGIKRGFGVSKNEFGIYNTGFTDKELKAFKTLPVWDKELERPNPKFWDGYQLILTSSEKRLNITKSEEHRIHHRIATIHEGIANSEDKVNSSTLFFILDEEAEAENANRELDYLTSSFTYIQKMSPSERRSFLSLFGVPTKNTSDNVIVAGLRQQAESSPQKFIKLYEDDNRKDKIIINEMVEYGILAKREGAFWFNEILIGTEFASTVAWMVDPLNQDVKRKLMQHLEIAKKR